MLNQKLKILIIGEDTRSFLSVIRSLGQSGCYIDVLSFDKKSLAIKSRYINKCYFLNYQAYTEVEWIDELIKISASEKYDIILPCDERSIFPIRDKAEHFPSNTILAIPNDEVIQNLFDKYKTRVLAEQLSIPHAKGILTSITDKNYHNISNQVSSKFVIKPIESFKQESLLKRQNVSIITNEDQFIKVKNHSINNEKYLIEEFFEGTGEGVSILSYKGIIYYYFAHKRVNEPKSGGGSSYRMSIPLDLDMANACKKICKATSFSGVGMFEFKRNPITGKWILIEVNARFWGSLPLAIYAGVDFPLYYVKTLINNIVSQSDMTPNNFDYKSNLYARSLSADLFDMKKDFDLDFKNRHYILALNCLLKRILGFYRIFINKEKIDTFDWKDLGPFKEEVKYIFNDLFISKIATKLKFEKIYSQIRRVKDKTILTRKSNLNIKFVCYGNIMRSPFAEKYLLGKVKDMNIKVSSYGFHSQDNRCCPTDSIVAARRHDIDLKNHRSKRLLQSDLQVDDIVIVFDNKNLDTIERYYNCTNVVMLSDLLPSQYNHYKEILDPYGNGMEALEECYNLIAIAINQLVSQIKDGK